MFSSKSISKEGFADALWMFGMKALLSLLLTGTATGHHSVTGALVVISASPEKTPVSLRIAHPCMAYKTLTACPPPGSLCEGRQGVETKE